MSFKPGDRVILAMCPDTRCNAPEVPATILHPEDGQVVPYNVETDEHDGHKIKFQLAERELRAARRLYFIQTNATTAYP